MPDAYILGIESSCDETAAAVVRSGEQLISNVVASQIATHQPYGGVVPELASREHLRAIVPVVRQALADAKHTYDSVDAIAVTQGPGLAGALLVGISYAKALAFALEKPLIAVNHLEGHIHAVLLEERQKGNHELHFPVLALVVSGGHTHLYLAAQKGDAWTYENIGHTRDDAAGEAFDKVAKLLGLGYPGGPVIDRLAPHGDSTIVKFAPAQIKHRDRRGRADGRAVDLDDDHPRFDFSYSGIKTAMLALRRIPSNARRGGSAAQGFGEHSQAEARRLSRSLRQGDTRPRRIIPASNRRRSGWKDSRGGRSLQRRDAIRDRWSRRQPGIATEPSNAKEPSRVCRSSSRPVRSRPTTPP